MSPLVARIILGVLLVALVVSLQILGALIPMLAFAGVFGGSIVGTLAIVYLIDCALDKDDRYL